MVALGRPISLNRKNIANLCLKYYWKKGFNNISYNDIIKSTKLSKGSFYKLFIDQDDLHAETLKCYYDYSKGFMDELSKCEDLFEFLSLLKNIKYKYDMKYCYFFSCYSEKYKLGNTTKNFLDAFKKKYQLMLNKIIKRHIYKNIHFAGHLNVKELVNYYFYNFIIINLLKRNNVQSREVNMYTKTLLRFTANLGQKPKD